MYSIDMDDLYPLLSAGREILPLLTLGVVYYYYGKRPTIRQVLDTSVPACFCQQEKEKALAEEDYVSQLPDDVLSSILAHLTIKEAARTSILSTRWKHVFATMPILKFRCVDMFGVSSDDHRHCLYYQQKFLKGVNQLLQLYSGRRVAHVDVAFCFGRKFSSEFDHWMRSISRLGVERLCLYFNCRSASLLLFKFSFELLSQAPSLKHLFLTHCLVQPSPKVCINSLKTITLDHVALKSGQLEGILSSCLNLEQLTLQFCRLPYKLCAFGTITSLFFISCVGVEELDLQTRNLHTLSVSNVRIYFSFVPILEHLMIDLRGTKSMPYIFGDFARGLPAQIKSISAKLGPSEVRYFERETKIFRNLRLLHLILVDTYDLDIVKFSPLLRLCPLLQDLGLDMTETRRGERGIISWGPLIRSPTRHIELKEVAFSGFHGTAPEIEFAVYILRSAMVLERMFINRGYRCYSGFGKWENMSVTFDERERSSIQRQLLGQAVSRKAVVIFQ